MHIRSDKLKQLYFSSMAAIIICVYLRFWFTSVLRGKEDPKQFNQTHSTLSPMEQKFNVVRYSDIVSWKSCNQSSSSFDFISVLSNDKRIYFHETSRSPQLAPIVRRRIDGQRKFQPFNSGFLPIESHQLNCRPTGPHPRKLSQHFRDPGRCP
jgi:hypothetical protein